MNFSGKYFDGKTSKVYPATIQLFDSFIRIELEENGEQKVIEWQIEFVSNLEEKANSIFTLSFGSYPQQTIEVSGKDFKEYFNTAYPNKKLKPSFYSQIKKMGATGIMLLVVVLVALVITIYLIALPLIIDKTISIIPPKVEKELSIAVKQNFLSEYEVNEIQSQLLNTFFDSLKIKEKTPVNITVVESSNLNAFSLPGGEIIVFSGLLKKLETSDELAALLLHEYAHIKYRHATRAVLKGTSASLFISILFFDANSIATILATSGNTISNLHFSRENEREADTKALEEMRQLHFNPTGMESLLLHLQNGEAGQTKTTPAFLRTHPLTKERLAYINAAINTGNFSVLPHIGLEQIFAAIKSNL
ncbi:MAG: M48 family metallopeptidase [Chitinophagales bacterium]|nr:M48 family metallopeptidase [Chitinophagales bacterium]MCO5280154.1 M48 family metallopeptidase [Chitinophagales bacterium]HRN94471.1 M48 family metallopeptidase [Chitinophagales bacterium]HRP38050.1 M48 family metallopeptidase [Chitinophagales bacterium]